MSSLTTRGPHVLSVDRWRLQRKVLQTTQLSGQCILPGSVAQTLVLAYRGFSHSGITNLHVPSDIIIDNSMPTAIRAGGKMWDVDDTEQDFKAICPIRPFDLVHDFSFFSRSGRTEQGPASPFAGPFLARPPSRTAPTPVFSASAWSSARSTAPLTPRPFARFGRTFFGLPLGIFQNRFLR